MMGGLGGFVGVDNYDGWGRGLEKKVPEVYALDFTTDEEGYLWEREWAVSCDKGEEAG